MSTKPLLELQNISKTFHVGRTTAQVLHAISLKIQKGEFVAIVGPSGSGKTTLTHIIGGLLRPTAGRVLIEGSELTRQSDYALSHFRGNHVGFVFQQFSLLPDLTASENVAVPLMLAGVNPRTRKQQARDLLQLVGLGDYAQHRPSQLSGGQRQRVSIARALIARPAIVIADEPTGSLDSQQGQEIVTVLQQLNREQGVTLLLVTHNPDIARRAGRIITLHDGAIKSDTHANR